MSDKIKIFVIDDQRIIGDLFDITLGYRGHEITLIQNPLEAIETIKNNSFDIVFLDILMPEKNGVEVLEVKSFFSCKSKNGTSLQ